MLEKRLQPYIRESLTSFCIASLINLFIVVVAIINDVLRYPFLIMGALYYITEYLFNSRLGIKASWDKKHKATYSETVEMIEIKDDIQFTGKWNSLLATFYPKELHVERYRIICKTDSQKKIIIRSAMSHDRLSALYILHHDYSYKYIITVSEKARILINIDIADPEYHMLSHKKKNPIAKLLQKINRAEI